MLLIKISGFASLVETNINVRLSCKGYCQSKIIHRADQTCSESCVYEKKGHINPNRFPVFAKFKVCLRCFEFVLID